MIMPTVGRIVWGRNLPGVKQDPQQPFAAMVTYVWNERMVNVVAFDHVGMSQAHLAIQLLQDGDSAPSGIYYCEWMPFQKGQAAKTEKLEQEAQAQRGSL